MAPERPGAECGGGQVHEPEEIPEEKVLDQPLSLHEESFLQAANPAMRVEDAGGLHLYCEAQAEVLLDVGFEVPPFIVRHRDHHLEHPARPAEGEQLGNLGLREAAELDVAETAHGWNNGTGADGLLEVRLGMKMTMAPNSRWLIPIGGGLLSAVLIVIGTPHVAWYLRLALALIAFAYIAGQSAAYLWTRSDQG